MTDTALNYGANEESADWCDFRSQVLEFYNYHTEEYMASSEVADWGKPEHDPTATLVLESDYGVTYRIPLVFCPIRREACIEVNGDPWEELCERSVYCWLWHEEGHARRALAELLRDAKVHLEHYGPQPPDHQCGTPNASCDGGCSDYAYFADLLDNIRTALGQRGKGVSDGCDLRTAS